MYKHLVFKNDLLHSPNQLPISSATTEIEYIYLQSFEGCNFHGFHGQLIIHKVFIFEISLAKLWLASVGEQDMHKWLLCKGCKFQLLQLLR